MNFWDRVKKDVQKSFQDGMKVIRAKAEKVGEEGKKRYRIFDLKHTVHKHMSELGGMVYNLSSTSANPMADGGVKTTIAKIHKLEEQIEKLEASVSKTAKKKAPKKAARKASRPKKQ